MIRIASPRSHQKNEHSIHNPLQPIHDSYNYTTRSAFDSYLKLGPEVLGKAVTKGAPPQKNVGNGLLQGTSYEQPRRRPKVYCAQCDECQMGFRGHHELRRHVNAKHRKVTKKYKCRDPATVGVVSEFAASKPLSACKACSAGKTYGAYYNAAAHLRRTHFKPKVSRAMRHDDKNRGGKGGGDWPPMSELKLWFEEVLVNDDQASISTLTIADGVAIGHGDTGCDWEFDRDKAAEDLRPDSKGGRIMHQVGARCSGDGLYFPPSTAGESTADMTGITPTGTRESIPKADILPETADTPNASLPEASNGIMQTSFRYDSHGRLLLGEVPVHLQKVGPMCHIANESGDEEDESPSPSAEESDIEIGTRILPVIKAEFVVRLLTDFYKTEVNAAIAKIRARIIIIARGSGGEGTEGEVSRNDQGSQTTDSTSAEPHSAPDEQTNGYIPRNTRINKRQRLDNGDGDEDDEGERDDRQGKQRLKRRDVPAEHNRLLACPYCKWKPLTYRKCRTKVLKEISRIKTHLWRHHVIPIHCAACYSEFDHEDERDAHARQRNCQIQEPKQWEGISSRQKEQLKRRTNTKLTREDQWYEMYTILFPGHPKPNSPYIEAAISEEMVALQDFMAQEWQSTFDKLFEERLPASLREQEGVVRSFANSVLEEAMNLIFERLGRAGQVATGAEVDSAYLSQSGEVGGSGAGRSLSGNGNGNGDGTSNWDSTLSSDHDQLPCLDNWEGLLAEYLDLQITPPVILE